MLAPALVDSGSFNVYFEKYNHEQFSKTFMRLADIGVKSSFGISLFSSIIKCLAAFPGRSLLVLAYWSLTFHLGHF